MLDLETNVWVRKPLAPDCPSALLGHTAVIWGDCVIVFGGEKESKLYSEAIYYYYLHEDRWTEITPQDGIRPIGRSRHAACLTADGKHMIVSGGLVDDGAGDVSASLYTFNLTTQTWTKPKVFVARYDHTITIHNNKVWAFGGLGPQQDRIAEVGWYDLETDTVGNALIISPLPKPSTFGTHFYGSGVSGTMVDAVVPGSTAAFGRIQSSITALDLTTLNWSTIMEDCDEYFSGFVWYHMASANNRLVFVGQPEQHGPDEKLTHVLSIDLSYLGYVDRSEKEAPPTGTIGYDMYEFFKQSLMCDFEITAVEADERPPLSKSLDDLGDEYKISEPIKVHIIVLLARWSHFRRIMASEMQEYHSGRLFIPEPVTWVRRLVDFMYRDSIRGCTVVEVTGLLILANLYDIPRLRQLCIEALAQGMITNATAILIWQRAVVADEKVICRKAAMHCFRNWGNIVRSKEFSQLSKAQIVALCNEADEQSCIVVHRDQHTHSMDQVDEEEDGEQLDVDAATELDGEEDAMIP
jgi:hypothetical protein